MCEAATAYKEAVDRLNARFGALAKLRAEANALADRFPDVVAPTLAPVIEPARRKACIAAALVVDGIAFDHSRLRSPNIEHDEHRLRTRRTYEEVTGTPAGEIISATGLQQWPELSAKQREIVALREREKRDEADTAQQFGVEAGRSVQRVRVG